MPTWILVLAVILAWCISLVASASAAAVEDRKNPLESGQLRGTSIFPALPVMPVAFVLVALGVDALLNTTWGSRVVVGAHVLYGIAGAILIARDARYIRSHPGLD